MEEVPISEPSEEVKKETEASSFSQISEVKIEEEKKEKSTKRKHSHTTFSSSK